MAIPGWIPGNPAGAGTCPRQKATNPDTGLAPPYPCLPGGCTGWGVTSGGCLSRGSPGRLKPQSARREGPLIEPSPVRHHMTRRHDPVRLCDGQPADDDDIPTTDIDALRDARAEATLCPVCQQNSHIHDYSLRWDRYQDGRRTLAHLYTVPVQYAFDGIRNCPHCRENPDARTCRAWNEARKSVRVLHREARRIAKDVTDLDGVTGGCIATVYQFADGSVAYFALDAPAWREADEIAGRALLAIKPLTTVFST